MLSGCPGVGDLKRRTRAQSNTRHPNKAFGRCLDGVVASPPATRPRGREIYNYRSVLHPVGTFGLDPYPVRAPTGRAAAPE